MKRILRLSCIALVTTPFLANAHPSLTHANHFTTGLIHPLTGADHLIAMVLVGIWAVSLGRKAQWRIPLAFVGTMAVASLIAQSKFQVPFLEGGIIASLFILGILVLGLVKLPTTTAMVTVGALAFFHGYAHGLEIPLEASAMNYFAGFLISTLFLHLIGVFIGNSLEKIDTKKYLYRFTGLAALIAGFVYCL